MAPVFNIRLKGLKAASVILAAFGGILLILWLFLNDGTPMSMVIMLAGATIVCISIVLFFISPSRYVRGEVCDAMARTGLSNTGRILSSLLVDSKGIYIPSNGTGTMKLFIPLKETDEVPASLSDIDCSRVFNVAGRSARGITLTPPGYDLYLYSRSNGAAFTGAKLEGEIKDVLENVVELASGVRVETEGDLVSVTMRNLMNGKMCASIRKDDPRICEITGCPVCSLVGCAVAEGTGRKVKVNSISTEGDRVNVSFKLL